MTQKELSKTSIIGSFREKIFITIFGTHTKAGRNFDLILLVLIVLSVFTVILESVPEIRQKYASLLLSIEWVFTILFSLEYILRVYSAKKPLKYIFSFYGLVDLISILPLYLGFIGIAGKGLISIRTLRLLRIFRILRVSQFLYESARLTSALKASSRKISVFLYAVIIVSLVVGTLMYTIEGTERGFTSIPRGMYWAIVTLTTVGYGDIAPGTPLGQGLAACLMILGYGIIAVPTGIITNEMAKQSPYNKESKDTTADNLKCSLCEESNHIPGAKFCHSCGTAIDF